MNRFRVVVCLCLGWLTLAGCQSLFGSSSSRGGLSGSGTDGGVCTKDPQTIKNVMLAPPMCSATNPCPCGTYCSSQTGGNCVADCVDDTWCAPGFTCSQFGQCLSAGTADGGTSDGAVSTNPTCPTNSSLLDSLVTSPRTCQFDDVCPFGSYCNQISSVCKSDCRTESDCAALNTGGQTFVCDCLGQCAPVGVPAVKPSTILPTLEVSPTQFTFALPSPITMPVWGAGGTRQVTVDVVAQFLTQSGTTAVGPSVTIQANPGPGLMVQCPGGTDGGIGPTGNSCQFTIDPTSYTASNSVFKSAPVTLLLQPSPNAPTVTSWTLRLGSTDVSNAPQSVLLAYTGGSIDSPAPPNPVGIQAPPAGYLGYGQVQLVTPFGGTLNLPVLAREFNGNLVLFDSSRVLTPSGITTVKQSANVGDWETFLDGNPTGEATLQGIGSGGTMSRITAPPVMTIDNSSGIIYGSFTRSAYTEHPFLTQSPETGAPTSPFEQVTTLTFSLQPAVPSAGGYCAADSDCPSGSTCDTGFCTNSGPKYQNEGTVALKGNDGGDATNFIHNRMSLWGGYSGGFDIPFGFIGLYAPSSATLPAILHDRTNGFTLNPPVPPISGEPPASLFSTSGAVVAQGGPLAIPLLTQHDGASSLNAAQLFSACLTEARPNAVSTNAARRNNANRHQRPSLRFCGVVYQSRARGSRLGRPNDI